MSRGLENFTPFIETVTSDYPWGNVKDGTGIGDGTDVNKVNHSDYHQTFRKLLGLASITPNGLLDNTTNGYQYIQALDNLYKKFRAVIVTGANLTLNESYKRQVIVVQGNAIPITVTLPNSTTLVDGESVTILNNNNIPLDVAAFTTQNINVFGVVSTDIILWQKGDYIQLVLDKANTIWYIVDYKITPIVTPVAFTSITPNSNFTVQNPYAGNSEPNVFQYRKNANNEIEFRGMVRIVSTTGSLLIMNLPVGSRPASGVYRPVWTDYLNTTVFVSITTNGNVGVYIGSISNGTSISLDGVRFSLDV